MRLYRLDAHTKTDLKVHLVWIPKYRNSVLTGEVALRVRDLLRQIAAEREVESGTTPTAKAYLTNQNIK